MKPLTNDEIVWAESVRQNVRVREEFKTSSEVALFIKNFLRKKYPTYYDGLIAVNYVTTVDGWEKQYVKIDDDCIMTVSHYSGFGIGNLLEAIEDKIKSDIKQLQDGKNVESIVPWAMEFMFEGKVPMPGVTILKHVRDVNFAYLETKVHRTAKTNYYGKRKSHTKAKTTERQIVIENWGKNFENYSSKNKSFVEKFQRRLAQKEAPKTARIQVEIIDKFDKTYGSIDRDETNVIVPVIKTNPTTNEPYVYVENVMNFKSDFVFGESRTSWVAYNDGQTLWIKSRHIEFDRGEEFNRKEFNYFFIINRYGGLVEAQMGSIPQSIIHGLVESEPLVPVSPRNDKQVIVDVNEDETEIIEESGYDFIKIELTKSSPAAREYTIVNTLTKKANKKTFWFANYEGRWIHSTPQNRKVKEMLEAYNLADKLTMDFIA